MKRATGLDNYPGKKNMNPSNASRRDFLKASMLAGLGASFANVTGSHAADQPITAATRAGILSSDFSSTRPRPGGQKPVHNLTTQPLEKVRVAVIGLHRGMSHVSNCLGIEFAEIVAVCDIIDSRAKAAARSPKQFARSGRAWLRVPLLQNCELLPQGQILQQKIISGSKRTNQKGECELQRTEQKPFVTEIASDPLFLMLQAKTRADTFNPRSTPQSFSASWIINHLDGLT